jgi:DNA-binding MarR family transcriptional regulator
MTPTFGIREAKVLRALMESAEPGDRSSEAIADRLGMEIDAVTAALSGLESAGFATKATDGSADVWIPVSEAGRDMDLA